MDEDNGWPGRRKYMSLDEKETQDEIQDLVEGAERKADDRWNGGMKRIIPS